MELIPVHFHSEVPVITVDLTLSLSFLWSEIRGRGDDTQLGASQLWRLVSHLELSNLHVCVALESPREHAHSWWMMHLIHAQCWRMML